VECDHGGFGQVLHTAPVHRDDVFLRIDAARGPEHRRAPHAHATFGDPLLGLFP
jgi:hypothetical protein